MTYLFVRLLEILSGEVFEAGEFADEGRAAGADFAVSLFADDQFGNAFIRAFFVVILIPVDKQNHIRILLDGAGFSQVRVHRPLVRSRFYPAIQLGQTNHRALIFLR